jgi:methionine-rich copper-binding protein CopC
MNVLKWLAAPILVAFALQAQAHTHLKTAVPAKGSTVAEAPPNLVLTFSGPVRLTALTVTRQDGSDEKKIAPLPEEPTASITVPAPKLGAGQYLVNWRIVGKDGHVQSGKFGFTVAPGKS